jgi:hypothetical protein
MTNNVLNYEFGKIKGKVAIISDEANLPEALFTIKKIKDSQIDLYIESKNNTILISDIKDFECSIMGCENSVFEYSVSEIFSPFEYNAVICTGTSIEMAKISTTSKIYATPVISSSSFDSKAKIA